jgi:hypothetical protein
MKTDPIENIQWLDARELQANHYNPNMVMNSELRLLERSIALQGWVQPVLITPSKTIIDGFHRSTLARTSKLLIKKYNYMVPCAVLNLPDHRAMCLTVRINRAKGEHQALKMADLVKALSEKHGMEEQEIAQEIGATVEEVRLLLAENIFKRRNIDKHSYSQAWIPAKQQIKRPS